MDLLEKTHEQPKTNRRLIDQITLRDILNILAAAYKQPDLVKSPPIISSREDGRRPRRTRKQLREAHSRALDLVKQQHPDWDIKRAGIRARRLVETYRVL